MCILTNSLSDFDFSELTPLAIALIAGGGGLLLLLLLIIFICCCVYCLQTPLHPVDQYPMKRPFNTFEDEGSVASSMDVFMLPRQRVSKEKALFIVGPKKQNIFSVLDL